MNLFIIIKRYLSGKCIHCGADLKCQSIKCNRVQLDNKLDNLFKNIKEDNKEIKIKKLKEKIRIRQEEKRANKKEYKHTPPRYDEIYFEGVESLKD